MQVGDVIEIVGGSGDIADTFARTQFVITGLVRSPYYLMTSNFGSSELGSGDVDSYVFVAPEAYAEDFPYTGAFVTATALPTNCIQAMAITRLPMRLSHVSRA